MVFTLKHCETPQYKILSDAITKFFNETWDIDATIELIFIVESAQTKSKQQTRLQGITAHTIKHNHLLGSLSQSILKAGHEYTSRMRNTKYILSTSFHILAFVEISLRTSPLKLIILNIACIILLRRNFSRKGARELVKNVF